MDEAARLDDLLSLWQRATGEGRALSPEELCRDCPELVGELRRRIAVLEQMSRLGMPGDFATVLEGKTVAPAFGEIAWPAESALPEPPGYEVIGILGKGGMGIVYEARDRTLGRHVAIKMIRQHDLEAAQRDRLLTEAQAIASLNHPHVVHLYEYGEHRGQPFFVMELVRGPTLQQQIAGQARPPREAAQLVQLLAHAMQAAHDQRIIHRDLKPGNILLAPAVSDSALNSTWGCPKVTDFGLARRLDAGDGATRTGDVAGTPSYMSPEQALGRLHEIGPTSDIYALGAILYELLTGRPPFRGTTFSAILQQLLHDDPVPPRRLQPETPRDLQTICLRCLQKEPARRYASAQALGDDLGRFLRGDAILARPVGWAEHAWRWTRRQPLAATLLAGVIVLVATAIAGLGYGWREAERALGLEASRADFEKQQREEADRQLYLYRIRLGESELVAGKPAWAEAMLRQCRPELRQWEWFHLMHRCTHADIPALKSQDGGITCIAAGRDDRFASASADGSVCIWRFDRLKPAKLLHGHHGAVNWISFVPNGDCLLSGGEDGKIVLWNLATDTKQHFNEHQGPISCIAVHPTKSWIASATFGDKAAGEILIWDRDTREVRHRLIGHTGFITGLSFSGDGKQLASCSRDRTVILWDLDTFQPIRTFREHRLPVATVVFSPDGKTLASAAGRIESARPDEDEMLLWEADTGTVQHRLHGHSMRAVTMAFTADGKRLATAGWDKQIKVWEPASGQEVLTLTGHQQAIMSLAFASDGRLISGSLDETIKLWLAPKE